MLSDAPISRLRRTSLVAAGVVFAALLLTPPTASGQPRAGQWPPGETAAPGGVCAGGNLREQMPSEYRQRYDRWKATFLSAATGRRLWSRYACDPGFRLTIVVSKSQGEGAKIALDGYQWAGGKLAAATIILGHQLDKGYPALFYYPVIHSLGFVRPAWEYKRDDVLAAAKMAHEFGHVEHAANSDTGSYRLQNELSQVFTSRFVSNGHDSDDPVLADLARRIGGTPVQIFTQREHRAETYALRYLLDRLGDEERRKLLRRLRKSLASDSRLSHLLSQAEWQDLNTPD